MFLFIYQACVHPQLGSHGSKEEGRRDWQISLLPWSVSLRRVRIISLRHSLFIVFVLWRWPRRDYWDKQWWDGTVDSTVHLQHARCSVQKGSSQRSVAWCNRNNFHVYGRCFGALDNRSLGTVKIWWAEPAFLKRLSITQTFQIVGIVLSDLRRRATASLLCSDQRSRWTCYIRRSGGCGDHSLPGCDLESSWSHKYREWRRTEYSWW